MVRVVGISDRQGSGKKDKKPENQPPEGGGAQPRSRRRRRRRTSTGTTVSMGGQLLGLSLFIMLLAFFMVLNAISQYEATRVHPVIESLSYAFASRLFQPQVDDRPAVTQSEETSTEEGDTLDRMEALFTAHIPGTETVLSQRRGEMFMKLSFADFEAAVMAIGQPAEAPESKDDVPLLKGFFLPALVALMQADSRGGGYRMDMMLNIGENPSVLQNSQPQQMAAIIKRMSTVADKIERAGLPVRLISAGTKRGEEGTIELHFRPHVPFNPLGRENPGEGDDGQE